jgi:copper chaperone CopZ
MVLITFSAGSLYAGCGSCSSHDIKTTTDKAAVKKADVNIKAKDCTPGCTKPCCNSDEKTTKSEMGKTNKGDGLMLATFSVKGMTCGGCESGITKKLTSQDGVSEVIEVSHKTNRAIFKFDPDKADAEKLAKVVSKMGYKAEILSVVGENENKQEEEKSKTM